MGIYHSEKPSYQTMPIASNQPPNRSVATFEWRSLSTKASFWQATKKSEKNKSFLEICKIISEDIIERPYHYDPDYIVDQQGNIKKNPYYKKAKNNAPPEKNDNVAVYKINHGTGHGLRQLFYTEELLDWLAENGNEKGRLISQSINSNPEIREIIKLAAFCKRIGRTLETESDSIHEGRPSDLPTIYSKRSAEMFELMAQELKFNQNLIEIIKTSMLEPIQENQKKSFNSIEVHNINGEALFDIAHAILEASHKADLVRIFQVETKRIQNDLSKFVDEENLSKLSQDLVILGCLANKMTGSSVVRQGQIFDHTISKNGKKLKEVVEDINAAYEKISQLSLDKMIPYSVKEEKSKLLQEIKRSLSSLNQSKLKDLFSSVSQGKENDENKYRVLWNQHDLFGKYASKYGNTASGKKALALIREALKQKICTDQHIDECFSKKDIELIFPGRKKDEIFLLSDSYFPSVPYKNQLEEEEIIRLNGTYYFPKGETKELLKGMPTCLKGDYLPDANNYNSKVHLDGVYFSTETIKNPTDTVHLNGVFFPTEEKIDPRQGPCHLNIPYKETHIHDDYFPTKNPVPIHVYRGDKRSPAKIISAGGFHVRELNFQGIQNHTTSNPFTKNYNGGISTSQVLFEAENGYVNPKSIFHSAGYLYRIKLNPYQGTNVNATLKGNSKYEYENEILVTHGIGLEAIEVQVGNLWCKLIDIQQKQLKISEDKDLNEELLSKSADIIKKYYNNEKNKAENKLCRKHDLQLAISLLGETFFNNISPEDWNKFRNNKNLPHAIIALKTAKKYVQVPVEIVDEDNPNEKFKYEEINEDINITQEDWPILLGNPNLQEAIIALWRSNRDLITADNWNLLKNDTDLQGSIIALWKTDPRLITPDNWEKLIDKPTLKLALSGLCSYMQYHYAQKFTFHRSIIDSKKLITYLIKTDDEENMVREEIKSFLEGTEKYAGNRKRPSGNGKNSRRKILGEKLNCTFIKNEKNSVLFFKRQNPQEYQERHKNKFRKGQE